jgi:alginate O-acetyltransferase complex protein AlgI
MLFNSLEFLIFFSVTTVIYFLIPLKFQKYFLLISGCVFYAFLVPWHLLILAAIVIGNYLFGRVNDQTNRRKLYLILIFIFNLGALSLFKYYNFLNSNVAAFAGFIGWNYSIPLLELAIPIGISFYIFKCLSYDIEVYRKNIPAEKRFEIFSLYILIYPELLAGPIDRPQSIIPQLETGYVYDYERVTGGLKLMAWGFFQKWVIADRLAPLVNQVYNNVYAFDGLSYVVATFFFAIQIYCDFSAYSDIAIGAGEVLGFKFMKNFNRPYFAKSVAEFWRRWHISLTTWLRDYLFLPIAYKILRILKNKPFMKIRPEVWSYAGATLITMLLAGLWHGANWTYIIWGSLIGVYLVFSYFTKNIRRKILKLTGLSKPGPIHKFISAGTTFSLICFSWIFFRANNIKESLYIVKHLYTGFHGYINVLFKFHFPEIIKPLSLGLGPMDLYLAVIFISLLLAVQLFQRKTGIRDFISQKPLVVRWALYLLLIFIILIYGKFETRQFIYLQF